MKLSDVIRKLAKYNRKRYMLFCVSVVFSVSMLSAFGILLFSPTVTNVLIAGGSTQTIALGMFAFTVLGMMAFLVYADSIYMKYKMDEIGVFLSLGLKQKNINSMLDQEFLLLFGSSAVIGLALSVPVAFAAWSVLTCFVSTAETAFSIGWASLWISLAFIGAACGGLMFYNRFLLKKMDIIKILKISSGNETLKSANPAVGLTGLIGIPVSFFLFQICESRTGFLGQISTVFLGISLLCLFLFTSEMTAAGSFAKKHFSKLYRKNILFFNLVRQKGRQYTLSLFVSTILVAVAIFGVGFIGAIFLENYSQVKEAPFDYSVLTSFEQAGLDKAEIKRLARGNEVELGRFETLDLLLIGRNLQYDEKTSEWSGQYVTSASSYSALSGENITVAKGTCLFYVNAEDDPALSTMIDEKAVFYDPVSKKKFVLPVTERLAGKELLNKCGVVSDMFILNDADYNKLEKSVGERYQLKYYLFNAPFSAHGKAFYTALQNRVVELSGGRMSDDFFDLPVRELTKEKESIAFSDDGRRNNIRSTDVYLDYRGNELYAARWWSMYPFSKESALSSQMETGAVYFLIMLFIAVIAFVSAVMVIGLKILGTIWQDEETYKKAVFLGLKEKDLRKLIAKQISFIYFYPAVLGCAIGILMINQIILASSSTHPGAVTFIAAMLALMILMIQVCIYFLLKKRMILYLLFWKKNCYILF